MKIEKYNFKWAKPLTPLNLDNVVAIALHHMAHPSAGIAEIESWHLAKGWSGFAYNFWVALDGTVYEGRGFNQGAGVEGLNSKILSIGFQGDYEKVQKMPEVQYKTGVEIIKYLRSKLPKLQAVDGHCRWNPTSCPGRYFPLAGIIKDSEGVVKPDNISIIVNGKQIETDVEPINIDGRVLVPVRAIAEALGASVEWDSNTVKIKSSN